jgi:hypothetical protein
MSLMERMIVVMSSLGLCTRIYARGVEANHHIFGGGYSTCGQTTLFIRKRLSSFRWRHNFENNSIVSPFREERRQFQFFGFGAQFTSVVRGATCYSVMCDVHFPEIRVL